MAINERTGKLLKLATLISQTINVIFYNGSPDETLSGRAYREGVLLSDPKWLRRKKWIDRLFFFQKEHCWKSHFLDILFAIDIIKQQYPNDWTIEEAEKYTHYLDETGES